ncbi:RfbD dTDP-4-dehydrorhamnose reductase [Candidatus Nanopelagicaceae bacterium]
MTHGKTLVLGSTGFLGGYFLNNLGHSADGHTSNSVSRQNIGSNDYVVKYIRNTEDVKRLLGESEYSRIINCIAMSDIDDCESNPEQANWLNTELPRILAQECKTIEAQLIHISTDAVFSSQEPFATEDMNPNPISVYGKTKYKGEIAVLEEDEKSLVCRVNFFGWNSRGKSLFNYFYSNIKASKKIVGFDDIFFTPLYARDTVDCIIELAEQNKSGLFHVVGNERISKFEFGKIIAEEMNSYTNLIERGSFLNSDIASTRTADLSLSNVKIKGEGIKIPTTVSGIKELLKEVRSKHE